MNKLSFILILCFSIFQSQGQYLSGSSVWQQFQNIIQLSPEEQLQHFETLQNELIQQQRTTDTTYTNLLFLYAGALFATNQAGQAVKSLEMAISISQQHPTENPKAYLSKYYYYLGYYYADRQDLKKAITSYHNAYNLGIQQFNKWGIPSLACLAISHLSYEIQDYQQAYQYARLGAQVALKNNDRINLTKSLYEQCINLRELSPGKQLDILTDSLISLAKRYSQESELAIYYNFLGDLYRQKKRYKQANIAYRNSYHLFSKTHQTKQASLILLNLYYTAIQTKDWTLALQYKNQAQQYTVDSIYLSSLYYNTALEHKEKKQYQDALTHLQITLSYLPLTFTDTALYSNPSALSVKVLSEKDYAFDPLFDKAEILSLDKTNKTHLKYALNTYMLLDTLVDYIRWQHQGIATKLFWREKLNSLYEQAIETAYQLNDTEKAFYFLEKSRAVLLLDQLNNHAAKNFLPQAEADKEAALRMQVNYEQNKGDPNEQLSDFLQAQAKLDAYVKDLEKRYPHYYEYKYNNHVPRLAEVQQYLANGQQSLLSYYEGKKGIYLLVVTPKQSLLKKIDSASYYSKKHELITFFAHPHQFNQQYKSYLQAANHFYQLVLAPIKAYLTPRVIVSTSGAIIPFAALSASAQQADYLVNHHAFSYTYSARALLRRQVYPSTGEAPNYFLGIAPVNYPYKTSLAQLPDATKALKENEQLFQSTLLLTNETANKANFETQWPQAKVVQLISHAYADQENAQPLIYFADSSLSLNDIHQERAQTQLLVLSACRTGVGKDYQGEGVFSLSRGFMATGVPSVYSTLWDVADQDAYALSHQILQAASKQVPLDLALQQAQINWLRKADRSKQLPSAWAGIILLGSSNPLPPEPANQVWLWYLLILLAGVGVWLWEKKRAEKRL